MSLVLSYNNVSVFNMWVVGYICQSICAVVSKYWFHVYLEELIKHIHRKSLYKNVIIFFGHQKHPSSCLFLTKLLLYSFIFGLVALPVVFMAHFKMKLKVSGSFKWFILVKRKSGIMFPSPKGNEVTSCLTEKFLWKWLSCCHSAWHFSVINLD